MDDKYIDMVMKQSDMSEKYSKRMFIINLALILALVFITSGYVYATKAMSDNYTRANESFWSDYMYSDYSYGTYEINQSTEVNK